MRRWRMSGGAVVLAATLLDQGCWPKKNPPKASIVIPPPPQAKPPQPMPTPPMPTADPKAVEKVVQKTAPVPTLPPPLPPPAKATKTPRPTRKTAPPVVETPQVVETPPVVPPVQTPGPSLQPILGTREVQERNQRIQKYLEKARLVVLRAERSNPDAKQKELIGQVRTFLQQAEEARKVDLARAENLAERAEVLSRGLAR